MKSFKMTCCQNYEWTIFKRQLPRMLHPYKYVVIICCVFICCVSFWNDTLTGTIKNELTPPQFNFSTVKDVIVFMHIPRTSGTTFGRHLVQDNCSCVDVGKIWHCDCRSPGGVSWLFSRFTNGWPCGLHADLGQLKPCVDYEMNKHEGVRRNRR